MTEKRSIRVIDSTMRDGSHAMAHQFTLEQIEKIAQALDEAGVTTMEISHGDGMGGASYNYGFPKEPEADWLRTAARVVKNAELAILLIPGIGTQEQLQEAYELGVRVARIATHCTEADISQQHIGLARDLGMETIGFLMLSHMISPEDLLEQAKLMESYGAQCIYVVDSAGAMLPDDYRRKVSTLRQGLSIPVGAHCHNNLGLSIGNSLAAIEEGAEYIDGCTVGLGAGAGNTPTEVLTAVLDLQGYDTGIDLLKIQDAAEDVVTPIMPRPQTIDRAGLTLGYAGVYSSFLLHTYRAAAKFELDPRDILIELGARKVVGGQEDTIIDLAAEMAQARDQQARN